MAPDYAFYDRLLWLGIGVSLLAGITYAQQQISQISHRARERERLTAEDQKTPEENIPLHVLETLCGHPHWGVRDAAQTTLLSRITHSPRALAAVIDGLPSHDEKPLANHLADLDFVVGKHGLRLSEECMELMVLARYERSRRQSASVLSDGWHTQVDEGGEGHEERDGWVADVDGEGGRIVETGGPDEDVEITMEEAQEGPEDTSVGSHDGGVPDP